MPPVDTVDLVADDADDFDALEEELGEIDANAIRVNAASRWPRAGEENREEDGGGSAPRPPRRYHFGDAWDAKGDDEARGWMRRAENTLMGAARVAMHARDEISTDAARAAAADSKRDDASDADADDARTVDDACERVVRNDIRSIIGLVFAFLVFAIVAVAVRMTAFRSPMRAAKQFAVAQISNLPAVVRLDPERVVAMQRKYIHDIEEERVILLERLRRERTELAGVQSEAPVAQRVHSMSSGEARSIHRSRASANPFTDALVSCVVLLQSSEITLALGCSHRVVVVRSPIRLPVRPSRLENVSNHDHGRVKRRFRPRTIVVTYTHLSTTYITRIRQPTTLRYFTRN